MTGVQSCSSGTKSALLPCPFCGAPGRQDSGFSPMESVVYAFCSNLDCGLAHETIFSLDEWNARPSGVAQAGQDERRQARLERSGLDIPEAQTLDDVVAQEGQDPVAFMVERKGDPTFPRLFDDETDAVALVTYVNVNPPATIRSLYASPPAALPAGEANLPTLDEYRNNLIEECAKLITELTLKHGRATGTDYEQGVQDHGYRILHQVRALALSSTTCGGGA